MDKNMLKRVLESLLAQGAEFADLRYHIRDEEEHIGTYNGDISTYDLSDHSGYGIRAYVGGSWGFAAGEAEADLETVAQRALANAQQSNIAGVKPLPLNDREGKITNWATPCEINPFDVSLEEKTARLLALDERLADEKVVRRHVSAMFNRREILYLDSYGSEIHKIITDVHASMSAYAEDVDGHMQRRSYQLYQDAEGTTGWENILSETQFGACERIKRELLEVCEAPKCEEMVCDVILMPEMMALQTHETIGHPLELDRILGYELSFAGGSHVKLHHFGNLKFGSPKLNAVADGAVKNSPGATGFDDDGEWMHTEQLIENGVLVGAISSRWSVGDANERMGENYFRQSGASCRAQSYNKAPIDRMNNINVLPGEEGTLEDIIKSTKRGILLESPRSWSIGSNRENFHFACEIGWQIENGRITGVVRNPTYSGPSLPFWRGLDAVGDETTWQLQTVFNCGKGQPNQIMRLGHGIPVCRFTNVQVGQ